MGWKSRQAHVLKKSIRPVTQLELETLSWQSREGNVKGEAMGSPEEDVNTAIIQDCKRALDICEVHTAVCDAGQEVLGAS
jgi:hypothetical protein